MKFHAIIPAAGTGSRMQLEQPKQYLRLKNGNSLLEQSASTLSQFCQQIVVAHHPNDDVITNQKLPTATQLVIGGDSRAESVFNALKWLVESGYQNDWVMVHDAARPFVDPTNIQDLIETVQATKQGAILATPITDTVKQVEQSATKTIIKTLDRNTLWSAQTPQIFAIQTLYDAYNQAPDLSLITDEASVMEQCGHNVQIVNGNLINKKITFIEDMKSCPNYRIGNGFDVHAFNDGNYIILGGVTIEHSRGIEAHSDGDVALHALCDALLGALALGDIGHHFPDTDAKWKNANSRELLVAVNQLINQQGYVVNNLDITIMAQLPKLAPYRQQMVENIATDLALENNQVSVKATTTEKLGFVGREEGIAVQAQVLLVNQ